MFDVLGLPQSTVHLAVNLTLGGLLAVLIRGIYQRWGETPSDRGEFGNLFPLFTLATIVAVYVARQSIALSLGLLGAVSIVRYRAAIKSPEELVYLLFCVAVGLALGNDQPLLAAASVPIVGLFLAVRHAVAVPLSTLPVPGEQEGAPRTASSTAPGNLRLVTPSGPFGQGGVDLARRELKFAMAHADSDKLRSILEVNCQRVSHRGPSTLVKTIYFDDALLSSCREHLEGVSRRAKVRLRWYDDDLEHLFFEIKKREYSIVYKERFPIRSRVPVTEMDYQEIFDDLHQILPPSVGKMLRQRPEASLITQYRREYFRSYDLSTRLTLDEQLVSYSQIGLRRPVQRFGRKDEDIVVLEAKVPENGGDELRSVLHPLAPYLTKSSKYVRGCLRLGLLAETTAAS